MKGVIIEKDKKGFTFLKEMFDFLNHIQTEYNWLITGHECYPSNPVYVEKLAGQYCWITGTELTKMVEDEDFQWIWGVFSAFPKHIQKKEVLNYVLPLADGYDGFWQNPLSIQHPLAEIEIVAWDSSATLVISKNDKLIYDLQEKNPFMENLEMYNTL